MSDTIPIKSLTDISLEGVPNLRDIAIDKAKTLPPLEMAPGQTVQAVDMFRLNEERQIAEEALASGDHEAFMNKWRAATEMREFFPQLSVRQIFNNWESVSAEYWGRPQEPTESTWQTIKDSFSAGLAMEAAGLSAFGMTISKIFGAVGLDEAEKFWTEGLKKDIENFKTEADRLNLDNIDDPSAIRGWLKTVASTAPSVLVGVAEFAAGGGIARAGLSGGIKASASGLAKTVTLAGEQVSKGQVLKAMVIGNMEKAVATGTSFSMGWAKLQGLDYIEMSDRGIPDEIAMPMSVATGAIGQVIEQVLALEKGVSALYGKTGLTSVTDFVLSKVHLSGSIQSAALDLTARSLLSTAGETAEETLQAINTGLGTIFAQGLTEKLMGDGIVTNPETIAGVVEKAKEAFVQTVTTAFVFGVPVSYISTRANQKELRELADNATKMSKPAFTEALKEKKPFVGLSEEETIRTAEKIYDTKIGEEADRQEAMNKAYEESRKSGEGEISRTDTGALRVEKADLGANDEMGGRDYSYDTGATERSIETGLAEKYGHIEVNEQGDTITLLSADFKTERAGLIDEVLGELIAQNPGKIITLSDQAKGDVFLAGAFSRREEMKKLQDTTSSPEDESMKNAHREQLLSMKNISPGQAEATIGVMQTFANASKTPYSKFWKPLRGIKFGDDADVGEGSVGAIRFYEDGKEVSAEGLKKISEAVVYVAQKESNAGVVTHELTHFGRVQMSVVAPEALKAIEEVYGITDGVWKQENDERLVREFTSFLSSGTVLDEKARPFFERIRDVIRSIWPHLKKLTLSPKVEEIFRSWFSDPVVSNRERAGDASVELGSTSPGLAEKYNLNKSDLKIDGDDIVPITDLIKNEEDKKILEDLMSPITEREDIGLHMSAEGSRNVDRILYAFPSALKGYTDIHSTSQVGGVLNVFGRGVLDTDTGITVLGDAGSTHATLERGSKNPLRFYYGYSKADKAVYIVSKNGIDDSRLQSSKILQQVLSSVFNKFKLGVTPGRRLQFGFALHMNKDELFNGGEDLNKRASAEASHYSSAEEWVEIGLGYKFNSLKESDKLWFKTRFSWIKEDKPKQFKKFGDFTDMLMQSKNLSDFLHALNRAISIGDRQYSGDTRRAKRVRDAISKSPEIVKAMEALVNRGTLPTAKEIDSLRKYVKMNEDIVMFLYAEVSGDQDLAQEALSNMKELPEMDKSDFIQRPGMTLADQAMILAAIKDDNLRNSIISGEASIADILEYEKSIVDRGNRAIKETKENLDKKYTERLALMRLKQQMRKERDYITGQPPANVDNTYLKILLLMKQYLRGGQKLNIQSMSALSSIVFKENPEYAKTFIEIIDAVGKKNFNEWTITELKNLSKLMKGLVDVGRMVFDKNIFMRGLTIKRTRDEIEKKLKEGKRYKKSLIRNDGIPEPGANREKFDDDLSSWRMFLSEAGRDDAVFNDIDRTGTLRKVIWESAIIAKRNEYEEKDRRIKPVLDFIKENNLKNTMHKSFRIKSMTSMITKSQLLGIRALVGRGDKFNKIQRERFIYGVLYTEVEKEARQDKKMEDELAEKVRILEEDFDEYITPDEEKLVQLMIEAFDNPNDKTRFIHSMLDLSGREMNMESYYFPIRQTTALTENEDDITDSIIRVNKFWASMREDGFTYDRQKHLRPSSNRRIQYDIMELFFGGIDRQEHLINMGTWAKDMKSIFSSAEHSRGLEEILRAAGGVKLQDHIANFIEKTINPNGFRVRGDGSELIKTMRGKLMVVMLSWRISTFLVQQFTSSLITMAYAPKEYFKTILKAYGSLNPVKWYESIEAKSAILRNRQLDPVIARLKDLYEKGIMNFGTAPAEMGFRFLNFADRFNVAIEWESVYQNELKKKDENGNYTMTPEQAAHEADLVIIKSQPSSEDMFRSALYSNVGPAKALLLQFTQPLNVIWNQLRYDVPEAFRERDMYRAFAIILCYALSGLAIGVVKALPVGGAGGPPEDADSEELARYWASYLFSQYTDSIPVVGSLATSALRHAIIGRQQIQSSNNLPLAQSAISAVNDVINIAQDGLTMESATIAAKEGFMALSLATGVPGVALLETSKLLSDITGGNDER